MGDPKSVPEIDLGFNPEDAPDGDPEDAPDDDPEDNLEDNL